jgi:hypothetical protein
MFNKDTVAYLKENKYDLDQIRYLQSVIDAKLNFLQLPLELDSFVLAKLSEIIHHTNGNDGTGALAIVKTGYVALFTGLGMPYLAPLAVIPVTLIKTGLEFLGFINKDPYKNVYFPPTKEQREAIYAYDILKIPVINDLYNKLIEQKNLDAIAIQEQNEQEFVKLPMWNYEQWFAHSIFQRPAGKWSLNEDYLKAKYKKYTEDYAKWKLKYSNKLGPNSKSNSTIYLIAGGAILLLYIMFKK